MLAIFIVSMGVASAETQDASLQITGFEDINGMRLKFFIEGITNVSGPWVVEFYNYEEDGTRTAVAIKDYDGASWNDIPAGSKHFDWIELDSTKLHAGYNIITAKIIFGPLNRVIEINPANNMDSFVIYYEPLPEPEPVLHVYEYTVSECSANCHEDRLPYMGNHNPRGIVLEASSICLDCHFNYPPIVPQNPYDMVEVEWLNEEKTSGWYKMDLEYGGILVRDTNISYVIRNTGNLSAHGSITVEIETKYNKVSKTHNIDNLNPGEELHYILTIPKPIRGGGISYFATYEMYS